MQDNINKTTQELFDKLIPNIDYTDGGASFIEFVRKQQEKSEKIK